MSNVQNRGSAPFKKPLRHFLLSANVLMVILAGAGGSGAAAQELNATISPRVVNAYYGDSFSLPLQLTVTGGTPPYHYDWTYQSNAEEPLALGDGDGQGGFLMSSGLTYGGGGEIYAFAYDTEGHYDYAVTRIVVGSHLEITQPLGNITAREGSTILLGPVEAQGGLGEVTITWWRTEPGTKDLVAVTDNDGNPATLRLGPLLPLHAGAYMARISDEGSNATGTRDILMSSATVTINTSEAPVASASGLVLLAAGLAALTAMRARAAFRRTRSVSAK